MRSTRHGILERVLLGGAHSDPTDRARRENVLVITVQCTQAGKTCFCVSMGTGPTAEIGFDVALTEVLEGARHYFALDVGSERGAELLSELPHAQAGARDLEAASAGHARAAAEMGREIDVGDIRDLLYCNYENPRWDDVAERCCGFARMQRREHGAEVNRDVHGDVSMPAKLRATPAAIEMVERLTVDHGKLAFFQSGGCCDGSSPICLKDGELPASANDVLLGEIGGAPFYVDGDQYRRWGRPSFLVDVGAGPAEGFSLSLPHAHFVTRSPSESSG
jgi:uncharacterized protein (DUF779 family)